MRLLVACSLLFVGIFLTLLLDGQAFSNFVLAIVSFLLAAGIALWGKREGRSGGYVVAILAILLMGGCLLSLSEAYRDQRSFNRRMEQIRQAEREEPRVGSGIEPGPGAGASATIEPDEGGPLGGREGR
jgi:hypothetical protein